MQTRSYLLCLALLGGLLMVFSPVVVAEPPHTTTETLVTHSGGTEHPETVHGEATHHDPVHSEAVHDEDAHGEATHHETAHSGTPIHVTGSIHTVTLPWAHHQVQVLVVPDEHVAHTIGGPIHVPDDQVHEVHGMTLDAGHHTIHVAWLPWANQTIHFAVDHESDCAHVLGGPTDGFHGGNDSVLSHVAWGPIHEAMHHDADVRDESGARHALVTPTATPGFVLVDGHLYTHVPSNGLPQGFSHDPEPGQHVTLTGFEDHGGQAAHTVTGVYDPTIHGPFPPHGWKDRDEGAHGGHLHHRGTIDHEADSPEK